MGLQREPKRGGCLTIPAGLGAVGHRRDHIEPIDAQLSQIRTGYQLRKKIEFRTAQTFQRTKLGSIATMRCRGTGWGPGKDIAGDFARS